MDVIDGAGGFNGLFLGTINNRPISHGIVLDLTKAANILDDGFGIVETAKNIEAFNGTGFADKMTGNGGRNNFFGAEGNDSIYGGGGEDTLSGGDGNDVIVGGAGPDHMQGDGGNDTLTGGADTFDQFNFQGVLADLGVDTITDFQVGLDNIWIDSAWGGGLMSDVLTAAQFRSGAGATTATSGAQRVIYNSTTGDLYFDADGTGSSPAMLFAHLSNHAALSFGDFNVFV